MTLPLPSLPLQPLRARHQWWSSSPSAAVSGCDDDARRGSGFPLHPIPGAPNHSTHHAWEKPGAGGVV